LTPKGRKVIDFDQVSDACKLGMADEVMRAAGYPDEIRATYFNEFEIYRTNKQAEQKFREYDERVMEYQQSMQELREAPPKSEPGDE
jgi:hypothetical protein